MNSQGWFPLGLIGLILLSKDSQESSPTQQSESISSLALSLLYHQLLHPYMTTRKTISLTIQTFVGKVMSLFLNMLSRFVIAFLPRSQHLLISWLQSPICSDFGAHENDVCHCFHYFPIYLPWSDGTGCHDWRVNAATIGKVEMCCLQTGCSAKEMDTALRLMVPCK